MNPTTTVAEALEAIVRTVRPLEPAACPLAEALGLVLAEPIHSDVDSPPFHKALMDGFAVRAADLTSRAGSFRVVEEVTAGEVPTKALGPQEATRIMTGAPLPPGADAVVRSEDADLSTDGTEVSFSVTGIAPGTNIMPQGGSMRRGEPILKAGTRLWAPQLAVLAEMGRAVVPVRRRPRIAILATGNELVPVDVTPGPGQIRNTNETMLAAQVEQAGAHALPLGIARDELSSLRERIAEGWRSDVLLLTGGVSVGVHDLVPAVLNDLGVRKVFHRVHMKPGKPVWFGVGEDGGPVVFGLPGNPVSSMVCFELFVKTAIRRLMGMEPAAMRPLSARLTSAFEIRSERPVYHPARLSCAEQGLLATPVRWLGSSDLRGTAEADSMIAFEPGTRRFAAGTVVPVYPWFDWATGDDRQPGNADRP